MRSAATQTFRRGAALALAGLLLVTGCSGSEEVGDSLDPGEFVAPTEDDLPAELGPDRGDADLVVWSDSARAGALTELTAQFAAQRGISASVQVVDDPDQTLFLASNAAGTGPDVVIGDHQRIGALVRNGALEPVDLSEADQTRYSETALLAARLGGQLHGLPLQLSTEVLYRDLDLVPDAPATVEDLVAAGEAAGVEQPLCTPVAGEPGVRALEGLWSSGGGYVFGVGSDGEYDVSDLGVGGEGALHSAELLSDLGAAGALGGTDDPQQALVGLRDGRCAFLLAPPSAAVELDAAGVQHGISPQVGFSGGEPARGFTAVTVAMVSSKGAGRVLGEQLVLDALNSPEAARALHAAVPLPPAVLEVSAEVSQDDEQAAVLAAAAEAGAPLPSLPQMDAVWTPLGRAHRAVVEGGDPRSTTLSTAAEVREALTGTGG